MVQIYLDLYYLYWSWFLQEDSLARQLRALREAKQLAASELAKSEKQIQQRQAAQRFGGWRSTQINFVLVLVACLVLDFVRIHWNEDSKTMCRLLYSFLNFWGTGCWYQDQLRRETVQALQATPRSWAGTIFHHFSNWARSRNHSICFWKTNKSFKFSIYSSHTQSIFMNCCRNKIYRWRSTFQQGLADALKRYPSPPPCTEPRVQELIALSPLAMKTEGFWWRLGLVIQWIVAFTFWNCWTLTDFSFHSWHGTQFGVVVPIYPDKSRQTKPYSQLQWGEATHVTTPMSQVEPELPGPQPKLFGLCDFVGSSSPQVWFCLHFLYLFVGAEHHYTPPRHKDRWFFHASSFGRAPYGVLGEGCAAPGGCGTRTLAAEGGATSKCLGCFYLFLVADI